MKRGWEVERVWRCAFDVEGEGRTYRDLASSTRTILALFVGSRWWMNSSRYALSDKAPRNFREAACEWRQTGMMIFWKPGFKSGFGSWFSQRSKLHVTSHDKIGKTERLVIPESRPTFDKEFRLLRKVFGLREKKRLFWIKKIRPFDLREGASSICEQTRLRSQRSASQFLLFIEARILPHTTLELP